MLSSPTQTRLFLTIVVSCFLVLIWQHRDVLTKPISLRPSASINGKNSTQLNAESDAPNSEEHFLRPDGLLEVNMDGRHPISVLMEDAKKRWRSMNDRQSKTLYEAVTEYKRRYGYPPPAGFNLWWDYVQKHNVKLVDEFDQINYDITPYLALSPKVFRQRLQKLENTNGFHFNISKGNFGVYGDGWWMGNPRQLTSIIMEFCRSLPDMVMHGHHTLRGDIWLGEDLRKKAQEKIETLDSFTETELAYYENVNRNDQQNLDNVCLPDDPVFGLSHPSKASFIKSHVDYLKVCSSSGVQQSSPLIFSPSAHDIKLSPFFVFSKCQPGAGFLLPTSTWDYHDMTLIEPHPWHERREPDAQKLFWRGKTTGWNWHRDLSNVGPNISWRNGSRAKLAILFGESDVTPQDDIELLLQDSGNGNKLYTKKYPRSMLNRLWMDVGFSGEPVQCSQVDGTCEEMNKTTIWKPAAFLPTIGQKKFFVDLDANDWSTDFQRRLAFGQVVFKSSVFVEWNTKWLIPYYHYIPIQSDYSDVYNIMAFFSGDPNSGSGAHEDLAEEISNNAIQFSKDYWRWEDMTAYAYRLLLEYARLLSDDRVEASYELAGDEYYK